MMRWLVLLLALIVLAAPAPASEAVLSAGEAHERVAAGDLVLIDIRTPAEWAKTGLPAGALAIALQNAAGLPRLGFVDDVVAALDGDRSRPLALICATGGRSSFARGMLLLAGFGHVHHVAEGMHGSGAGAGWLAQALPIEPCRVC